MYLIPILLQMSQKGYVSGIYIVICTTRQSKSLSDPPNPAPDKIATYT